MTVSEKAILARYRMYRQRSLISQTLTKGDTLVRRNEMLIVAMARYIENQ